MGYGNPMFDGDVPLPDRGRKPRIISMRLWLGAVLAGTLGEAAGLADHHDEARDGRSTGSQWPRESGDWNGRG